MIPKDEDGKDFVDFVASLDNIHPVWSNPDATRMLIQVLRSNWPSTSGRYYDLDLQPLDDAWLSRLEKRFAPVFARFQREALIEATSDPVCLATIEAMEKGNGPIRALRAELAYAALNTATPDATMRSSSPRL